VRTGAPSSVPLLSAGARTCPPHLQQQQGELVFPEWRYAAAIKHAGAFCFAENFCCQQVLVLVPHICMRRQEPCLYLSQLRVQIASSGFRKSSRETLCFLSGNLFQQSRYTGASCCRWNTSCHRCLGIDQCQKRGLVLHCVGSLWQ